MSTYEQTDEDSDLQELMLKLHRRVAEHLPEVKKLIQTFNFSPEVRRAPDEAEAEAMKIADGMVVDNIKKGWAKVG